jgi:aspartate racemase
LPTVDLIEEVARHITEQGYGRIGILGTATVMQSRLYGAQTGAEIIPPSGPQLQEVHQAYIAMAASGLVTQAQRDVFNRAGERLMGEAGAEAIMLGGTDLALAFNKDDSAFPLIDCAGIHADAATKRAMGLAFK